MPNKLHDILSAAFREQLLEVGSTEGGDVVLAALSEPSQLHLHGPAAASFTLSLARMALSKGLRIQLRCDDDNTRQAWQKLLSEKLEVRPAASAALLEKINEQREWQKHSQQSIFGHYTLADLLALQAESTKTNKRPLLTPFLSTLDYHFSVEELLDYRQKIGLTQRLYNKTGPLPVLIQELNTGIFYHQSQADSEQFIREKIAEYTSDCHQLARDFLVQLNTFYWQQQAHYLGIYQHLAGKLRQAQQQQAQLQAKYGEAALQSVPSRWSASLDKKQKALKAEVRTFFNSLQELHEAHKKSPIFLLEWPATDAQLPPSAWFSLLTSYQQQLSLWYEELPNLLREESLGLSSRSGSSASMARVLAVLEKQLEELLGRINDGGLFQRPLTAQAHATARQQKQLEQLLEKLLQLQALLANYPAHYRWQHNWFTLPANLRRILAPLLLFPEDNWAAAFEHWYLQQAIAKRPLSSIAPYQTSNLPKLFQEMATAKARLNAQATPYSLKPSQLLLPDPPSHEAVDLIIDLRSSPPSSAGDESAAAVPSLRLLGLCPPGIPNSYYLWQQSDYSPAMLFFCPWSSSRLPRWRSFAHPTDFYQLSLLLGQQLLAEDAPAAQQLALRSLLADISATHSGAILFGLRPDGQFFAQDLQQSFWGVSLSKGCLILPPTYRLPDLLALSLDRLAEFLYRVPEVMLIHGLPADTIQQALLTDGLNTAFLLATFLRASEAIEDQDLPGLQAMAAETRHRIGLVETARPALPDSLLPLLQASFPAYRLLIHTPWRDTFLPLLLESPSGQRHVVLPDGLLAGSRGIISELSRQEMLLAAGFRLHYLYCEELLKQPQQAIEMLKKEIEKSYA